MCGNVICINFHYCVKDPFTLTGIIGYNNFAQCLQRLERSQYTDWYTNMLVDHLVLTAVIVS